MIKASTAPDLPHPHRGDQGGKLEDMKVQGDSTTLQRTMEMALRTIKTWGIRAVTLLAMTNMKAVVIRTQVTALITISIIIIIITITVLRGMPILMMLMLGNKSQTYQPVAISNDLINYYFGTNENKLIMIKR